MPSQRPIEISFVSSDTFKEIFQASAEGIIMVDESGKVLLANPVSEKMFGYNSGELEGMKMEELLPDRYRHQHVGHRAHFKAHPEPRRMGVGRDLTALRKDGTEFPVEVSLSYTKAGGNMLVMAFISDITQRKEAEQVIRKSEEQLILYATDLEKKVQNRTETLNRMVHELEKANQDLQEQIQVRQKAEEEARKALEKERELNDLKSKFVSIASHEFRTPLSTVLSSASLIKQYNDRQDPEKADKHINRIKSSVNHLTDILNEFLSLGKLEEGKIEVQKEDFLLSEFLDEVKEEVSPLLKEQQKISVDCLLNDGEISSDPRILRNILFNLVSNASKYSNPGSTIWVTAGLDKNVLSMAVRDEGIGIPGPDIKFIFDRFFRASNAGTFQGTGLGLSIVKRYVELLNGNIIFTSEEGKGSTFSFTLPLEQPA